MPDSNRSPERQQVIDSLTQASVPEAPSRAINQSSDNDPGVDMDEVSRLQESLGAINMEREMERRNAEKRTVLGQIDATAKAVPRAITSMVGGTFRGLDELTRHPDSIEDGFLYEMGDRIDEAGRERWDIPEEYEGTVATDFGGAIGSLAGFIGLGGAGGAIGRGASRVGQARRSRRLNRDGDNRTPDEITQQQTQAAYTQQTAQERGGFVAAGLTAGPLGSDEAYQRAKEFGVEDSEELQSLARQGVLPGLVQIANINKLLEPFTRSQRNEIVLSGFDRIARDAASEATVEGLGAIGQNQIASSYDPDTGMFDGVAYQAALGGVASGALQGTRMGMARGVERLSKGSRRKQADQAEQVDVFEQAAESGDVSAYTNPEDTANYDKSKAAMALMANNFKEDTTPEQRESNTQQVETLLSETEAELREANDQAETFTDAGIAANRRRLKRQQEDLAKATNPEDRAWHKDNIAALEQSIETGEQAPKEQRKALNDAVKKAQAAFDATRKVRDDLVASQDQGLGDPDTLKSQAGLDGDADARANVSAQDRAKAADDLTTMSMTTPDILSAVDAQTMVADTDNGLSESQRAYLGQYAESAKQQEAVESLGRTSSAIFKGEDGFRGIQDYRSLIGSALNRGETTQAQEYAQDLKTFAQGHANKANALSQAFKQFGETRQPQQVVRGMAQGEWSIAPTKLSNKELKENQGLTVNAKSKNLIEAVRTEARALDAASKEMDSMLRVDTAQTTQPADATTTPEATAPVDETPATDTLADQDQQADQAASEAQALTTPQENVDAQSPSSEEQTAPEPAPVEATQEQTTEADTDTGADTDSQSPAPVVDEAEAQAPVLESGKLDSIANSTDQTKGTLSQQQFRIADLIGAYFTQSAGKATSTTLKPLVAVKDFLSNLDADPALLARFVNDPASDLTERSNARQNLIGVFTQTAGEWNQDLDALFKPVTNKDFRYRDLVQFLSNDEGNLPENVKTAISYAAWTQVAEEANGPWANTDEQINTILQRPVGRPVSKEERNLLIDKGTRANVVINSMGARAVQALGLTVHNDAPVNAQSQLESALGGYALALLMKRGLVQRPVVKSELMANTDPSIPMADQQGHPFVRLARDWEATGNRKDPVDAAKVIGETVRGTQAYLDKLIGAEAGLKEPSFEAQDFTQAKTKGTSQNVGKTLSDIQDSQAKKAWRVRTWFNGLWDTLDNDVQESIVGMEDTNNLHVTERLGAQGRNDNLLRELEHWEAFLAGIETKNVNELNSYDQSFYFMPNVWVNQRAGLLSNTVNPQASKIHRHLMGMADWAGAVSTTEADPQHQLFLSNVAMGLGIKADKMPMEKSHKELSEKVNSPLIRRALESIKKQQDDGDLSRAEQESIRDAVKQSKEKVQSLDALHAYARMEVARDNGESTFDTDMMMMEVDGVTNGPMLTLLLLGAAQTTEGLFKSINKGGFFEQGSPYTNFVEYKDTAGASDLYETTAAHMATAMQKRVAGTPSLAPVMKAVEYVKNGKFYDAEAEKATGTGRSAVKTPLTGMMFGQEVANGVADMFNEFIEDVYTRVSDISKSQDTPAQKRDALVEWATNVNALIEAKGGKHLRVPARPTLDWALEFELSDAQKAPMRKAFNETVGQAVETSMAELFGTYLSRRKTLNQGAQVASQLYTMMFDHLKQQKINELVESGALPSRKATGKQNRGDVQPLQELSRNQIQEIETQLSAMKPVAHSAMSQADADLDSALFLPKEGRELSGKASYQQEVSPGEQLPGNTPDGNNINSISTKGYESVLDSPGVRSLILMVHSADSAISAYAYNQLSALNVHDANGLSIADVAAGAQNLNEATYQVMLAFSVPMELKATLERVVTGLHGFEQTLKDSPQLKAEYKKLEKAFEKSLPEFELEVFKNSGLDFVSYTLREVNKAAFDAEIQKLRALSEMGIVDQYAQEGGEFHVTDALREEAASKLSVAEAARDQGQAKLNQLAKAVNKAAGGSVQSTLSPTQDAGTLQRAEDYFSAEDIASALKDWHTSKLVELEAQARTTGQRDMAMLDKVKNIQKVAELYPKMRSVATALESVFPGADNAKRRAAWESAVINQVNNRPAVTTSALQAPRHAILPLMDQLISAPETSTELQNQLSQVREVMIDSGSSLALAVDATLTPVDGSKVVEAVGALYNGSRETAYGRLGTPAMDSDTSMVAFMENNPNMAARDLMNYMDRRFREQGSNANRLDKFNRQLLALLKRTVNGDVPVRYITQDSSDIGLPEGGVSRAKGWYEPSSDNTHIGIKSPDFVHSGVSPELVLHELTHLALSRTVANEQAKAPKDRGDAWELVQDLEAMRSEAEASIDSSDDASLAMKYKEATSNVHEFIAWGMTNRGFQADVLNVLPFETDVTAGNRFINGMARFIDKITSLLFGSRKDAAKTRGLSTLISNVSGLFAVANENQNQANTAQESTQRQQESDPFETVKAYTTEQVFEALGRLHGESLSSEYGDHLRDVLGTIVSQLHGPYGAYKAQAEADASYGNEAVFIDSLMGKMPFASEILGQTFRITQQEAFVLEQVEATMQASLNSSTAAYRELGQLYKETKARLNPEDFFDGDWNQATREERAEALAQYRFIFQPSLGSDGTSNYLSRFAAMGLAYAPLRDKMNVTTARDTRTLRDMPLGEMLQTIFQRLLNALNGRLTKTFQGQRADNKLTTLMSQLVSIEARNRSKLASKKDHVPSAIEGSMNKLSEAVRGKADQFGRSKFFRDSKSGVLRATGVATSAVASDRVRSVFDSIQSVRNQTNSEKEGIIASVVTEVKGANPTNMTAHQLLRVSNRNQQHRKLVKDETAKLVLESFANKGKLLTDNDKAAITRVVLRTDMAALVDTFTPDQLLDLVRDPSTLNQEIRAREKQLHKSGAHRHYWLRGAKDMAYFMVHNVNRNDNLMLNAHNLARLTGTDQAGTLSDTRANEMESQLDQLVSLYALQYSPSLDKGLMADIMKTELARGNESGVAMTLGLHQQMKNESMETLFEGQPAQFRKGYTREIHNPYKQVVIASGMDATNLRRMGARQVGPQLETDAADSDQSQKSLFVIDDGGLGSRVTGVFSNTAMKAAGRRQKAQKGNDATQIKRDKEAGVKKLFEPNTTYDPGQNAPTKMVPVINNQGQVSDYRYMMSARARDTLLERNNNMEDVLGAMASNITDKIDTKVYNNKAVEALRDQYREQIGTHPDGFLEFSPNSPDPEVREAYRLLPQSTRDHIKKVWGRNAMMVRKDLYDLHFGYRKASMATAFEKDADERSALEQTFVATLETLLGKKAALRVRQAEDIWQEIVKQIKDLWVIKNLFTFLANHSSNVSILIWMGVPVTDIVKNHRVALNGIMAYGRDQKELMQLEKMQEIGYGNQPAAEVDARIVELKDAMARNPVKELVDAGIFQNIIEDVDNSSDDFGYMSKLSRKVDGATQWLPDSVKQAGKAMYMTHDTPLYKLMFQGTYLSDFVSRYTLYQHMINRKKNPMSKDEAVQLAVDAFVNYDIPTNRFLQYMNDMGLVWFTKYYLRIQKVMLHMYKEHPANALGMGVFASFFDSIPTVIESGFWNRMYNPLSSGALNYPGAVDEAMPIKAAMQLFK